MFRHFVTYRDFFETDASTAVVRTADQSVGDVLHELRHLKEGAEKVECWEDNWEKVMGKRMRFILFSAKF